MKAYLFLMLSEIACHYQKDVPSLNPSRRDVPVLQDSFTKVLDYIEENLTQDITIDQLSQVAAMNRYYFPRSSKADVRIPGSVHHTQAHPAGH